MDREEIKKELENISKINVDDLKREDDLGKKLGFSDVIDDIKKLIDISKNINVDIIDDITNADINKINKYINDVKEIVKSIKRFEPQNNAKSERDAIVHRIRQYYENNFHQLITIITYSIVKSIDLEELKTSARNKLQEIESSIIEKKEEVENLSNKINDAFDGLRRFSEEMVVSQQSKYFKEEAEKYQKSERFWFWALVLLSSILLVFSVSSMFIYKIVNISTNNKLELISLLSGKFLVFTVLVYGVFISSKNYMSNRHNSIVNRHRQNALMTYKALVEAAPSEEGREIILNQAASCIFSPQETGFTKAAGDKFKGSVVDIIPRTVMKIGE